MIKKFYILILPIMFLFAVSGDWSQAQVNQIPALTLPTTEINFETLPLGPTSIHAIRGAYPEANLENITTAPSNSVDDYDACFTGINGPSLAGNADGSGNLTILEVGQNFRSNGYTIELQRPTTQFGFTIQDEGITIPILLFFGNNQVGSISIATGCSIFNGFESERPFDRIVFEQGGGGYLLDTLFVTDIDPSRPIPTLSEWGLIAMSGVLGIVGFLALRRRKLTA